MVDISVSELAAHDCSVVLNIAEPPGHAADIHPVRCVSTSDIHIVSLGKRTSDVLDAGFVIGSVRLASKFIAFNPLGN